MTTIAISEHFYSIQGEGASVGVPAVFLRLKGCNLNCGRRGKNATWQCDTFDVWTKGNEYTIPNAIRLLIDHYATAFANGARLIITGGEPLLQCAAIVQLLQQLQEHSAIPSFIIEIELLENLGSFSILSKELLSNSALISLPITFLLEVFIIES